MIPGATVDVLYIKEEEVAVKASEEAAKKHFKKQETLKATNDVAAALDQVDDSETASKPLKETIRKKCRKKPQNK